MEENDLIEDGEIPSSPDDAEGPYKPLQRPVTLEHKYKKKDEDEPVEDDFDNRSEGNDESDDSDCDNAMTKRMRPNKMEVVKDAGGGGDVFKRLAANFQASIQKNQRNNVWGSFLQEDSLNSEIQNFGVGRNLKDIQSDRGAETYDYIAATNEKRTSSQRNSTESMDQKDSATLELNADLDSYWNNKREDKEDDDRKRRTEAIQAGKKRSVKERLGARQKHNDSGDNSNDAFETMSIPPPGVPRQIAELNPNVLESIQNVMDEDSSAEAENKAEILGDELAAKLSEPKSELMVGVVDLVGHEVAVELFNKTKEVEAQGGMMIKNGERRRTPGGVFLQLLRDYGHDENEARVNHKHVKLFFAQSNRDFQGARKAKKHSTKNKDFKSDLEAFRKMSKHKATKQKEEETEAAAMAIKEERELKPLPDILSCVAQRMSNSSSTASSSSEERKLAIENAGPNLAASSSSFTEPPLTEAPPNSVERIVNSYDDDFLNTEYETEDIELF